MKKTLVALAALAVTGSAFAAGHAAAPASSVTLYGVLDGAVVNVDKAGATGKITAGFADSQLRSSVWGIRGTENLGGGMRAVFAAEGDLTTSSGFTSAAGIFRRAANVGLGGGFGEVRLGVHANVTWASWVTAQVLPSNAVMVSAAQSAGFADSFLKQAVTYTSPKLGPATIQFQYGFGNSAAASDNGSVTNLAAHIPFGGFELRAAISNRRAGGVAPSAANDAAGDKDTMVLGAKYTAGPFAVGLNYVSNEIKPGPLKTTDTETLQVTGSYALSKQLTLGGSYTTVSGKLAGQGDSSLFNLQARYALSPRTSVYGLLNATDNKVGTAINPTFVMAGVGGAPGKKQNALGVGVFHAF